MRTLLLLRGAPGAGKSTWIQENHLEQYTIEADAFRQLISNPVLTEDGTFAISQTNDYMAWSLLFTALENRMKRGDFTIVDATHSNENMFRKYKALTEKYRYKVYYKQFNVSLDELKQRNLTREEHKRVPLPAVERVYALIQNTKPQAFAQEITDISEIINYWTEDLTDKYDHIKIIGDIQGCYTVLKEAIGSQLDPKTKYIFAGDLLDRGIENKEVLDFMLSIYKQPNVVFIEGNHDEYLRNWAMDSWELTKSGKPRIPAEFKFRTLPQLLGTKSYSDFAITINKQTDKTNDTYIVNGIDTNIKTFTQSIKKQNESGYTSQVIEQPYLQYKENTLRLKPHKDSNLSENTGISVITVNPDKLKSSVRQFVRRFRLAYAFEFHGRNYFVNHAGISALPNMTTISGTQLIRGVGGYETEIDKLWEASYQTNKTQGFIQVHGHRSTTSTEHSICLEDQVEYGGNLVVLDITQNGYEVNKFTNTIFKIPSDDQSELTTKPWVKDTLNPDTNQMIRNKYIRTKELDNNLMSLNFTEKAFKKGKWNTQTLRARGLFVDQTSGDIVMRSYNKFFNLNENKNNSVGTLKETLVFPIMAYKKYNGFLGIAATINDQFTLASKSTTSGPFKDMFQEIYNALTTSEKEQLTQLSKEYNCSFTFEVLHTDDRHIIDFDKNQLIILDAIPNSYEFNGIDIDHEFSNRILNQLKIESDFFSKKELITMFDDMPSLLRYVHEYKHDRTSEGLVIEDQNGFMFKIKYDYYRDLKRLRGLKQMVTAHYYSGSITHFGSNATEVSFISWCAKKPYEYLKENHIIDIFNDYEKDLGSKVL